MPDQTHTVLALVFHAERAKLVRVAARITRSRAEAEDIVQAAFLRATERSNELSIQHMLSWFHVVVRRMAIDSLRKSAQRLRVDNFRMTNVAADDTIKPPSWAHLSMTDVHVMAQLLTPIAARHVSSLV